MMIGRPKNAHKPTFAQNGTLNPFCGGLCWLSPKRGKWAQNKPIFCVIFKWKILIIYAAVLSASPCPIAQAINNLLSKSFGIRSYRWYEMVWYGTVRVPENTSTSWLRHFAEDSGVMWLAHKLWQAKVLQHAAAVNQKWKGERSKEQGQGRCSRVFNIYEQYVATVENARAQDVPPTRTHLPTSQNITGLCPYIAYSI